MKKEIADYIGALLLEGKLITNAQACVIAYWEFADFQGNIEGLSRADHLVINKILGEMKDEVSTLV